MKVRHLVMMTGALVAFSTPISAQTLNGNILYGSCATNANGPDAAMKAWSCLGYVWAVSDMLSSGIHLNGYGACIPAAANMGQEVEVVKKFLRDHPEKRHLIAAGLVAEALAGAFPCKR